MDTTDWVRAFNEILGVQIDATRALADELEHEFRALLERDLQGLDDATATKRNCLESLERVDGERRTLVSTLAGNPEPAGLAGLLRRMDPSGRAADQWRVLTDLLDDCRLRNLRNGRLVALRRSNVLRSLSQLRGGPTTVTYDPAGLANAVSSRRDLARA